ncbi:MAG: B12-binding domain-containing radical SAM protein [Thermodesulfobacteriota bacterium]
MNIAFVVTPVVREVDGKYVPAYMDGLKSNPHVAPYLLTAILKRKKYPVTIYDVPADQFIDFDVIAKDLSGFDAICFSVTSFSYSTACIILKKVKGIRKDAIVVIGGIHASILNEQIMRNPGIDYAIAGEGEVGLPNLVSALITKQEVREVPGLIYRGGDGRAIRNTLAPFLQTPQLNQLPIPAFEDLPKGVYASLSIESSRGCKSHCAFCASPHHKTWRPIDPGPFVDKMVKMLPLSQSTRKDRSFCIVDDCFTTDARRVIDIMKLLDKRCGDVELSFDARAVDIVREPRMVQYFAPFCNSLLIGAESCDNKTLRRIGKPVTKDMLIRTAQILYRNGIAHKATFSAILCFPRQTLDDCKEMVKFFSGLVASYGIGMFFQWCALLPGSKFWEEYHEAKGVQVTLFQDLTALEDERLYFVDNLSDAEIDDLCELLFVLREFFATLYSDHGLYKKKVEFSVPRAAMLGRDKSERSRIGSGEGLP